MSENEWEAVGHFWSLLDMLRFYAGSFVTTMSAVSRAAVLLNPNDPNLDSMVPIAREFVVDIGESLKELHISSVILNQHERLNRRISADSFNAIEIAVMFRELHENIVMELASRLFFLMPQNRRTYYEQPVYLFGPDVVDVIPNVTYDIEEAGRCLALGRWTACVFHLMRILEIGLHQVALKLDTPMSPTIDVEGWKNIIDQLEKKIREFESLPRTAEKSAITQFYSELAVNFRYFKDAWRNHVSHARATYDEERALIVWAHVREFMRRLAAYHKAIPDE